MDDKPVYEKVRIGKDEHTIEVKPITLVYPSVELAEEIQYDEKRLRLDSEATVYHFYKLSDEGVHAEFATFWNQFFKASSAQEPPCKPIPSKIKKLKRAYLHIGGLIDLNLKMQDMGVPVVWITPEDHLHPGLQVALADLMIRITNRAGDVDDNPPEDEQ